MSFQQAVARAQGLREALLDHGVRTVSIELVRGRGSTPNGGWWDDKWVGSMGHHIVSRRSMGLTPGLNLVKVGRSDLPGPLCNGYGGFDEVARIISLGWANHPGQGGPYAVPSGTVPANNGRPYWFGWEHEGGLDEGDWTDSFRLFMGRCHAGTLDWLGLDDRSHIEHFTWAPNRKIDRLNYTLATARAEVRHAWKEPPVSDGPFKDVPANHPHAAAIEWAKDKGITRGANPPDNTLFAPDRPVTRAELVTMLRRAVEGR